MAKGIFYGVGVGSGDPELITVKALRTIEKCEYISFIDPGGEAKATAFEIAKKAFPEVENKKLIRLNIPMTNDLEKMRCAQNAAAEQITDKLKTGSDAAFLTLGDVSVYSTFGYLRAIIEEKEFETKMIPGITSFSAAAAALGEDLVLGQEALYVTSASSDDIDGILKMKGTKVLMKGPSAVPVIVSKLKSMGLEKNARIVTNCGMENERIIKNINSINGGEKLGYFSLIIVKGEKT